MNDTKSRTDNSADSISVLKSSALSITAKHSVIVGTMTGGQGKTLISQLLAIIAEGHGRRLRVIAMDSVDESSTDACAAKLEIALRSKKGHRHITCETLPLDAAGASVDVSFFVPHNVNIQFEKLGEKLMTHDCLIDLGANVIDRFIQWLGSVDPDGELLGAANLTFVIPITNEPVSLQRAIGTIQKLRSLTKHRIKLAVVMNEIFGKIPENDDTLIKLNDLLLEAKGLIFSLENCRAYGLKTLNGVDGGIGSVVNISTPDYQELMKSRSIFEASMDLKELLRWIAKSMERVAPIIIPAGSMPPGRKAS